MVRTSIARFSLLAPWVALVACGSSSSTAPPAGDAGGPGGSCPDVSGSWTVKEHCDASLIGQSVMVRQTECALSFAAPFDQFSGTLAADGKVVLSGPQSCTGTASASSISMTCTPGTCVVTLVR